MFIKALLHSRLIPGGKVEIKTYKQCSRNWHTSILIFPLPLSLSLHLPDFNSRCGTWCLYPIPYQAPYTK